MYLQATLQGCGQLPLKHIQQPLASNSPVRQHSISLDILQANSPSAILKTTYIPYVFDWENASALHAMQGNRGSSRGEGEVSCVFSICD